MPSFLVPPLGTEHGPNVPVRPAKPVIVTEADGQERAAMLHDQMRWATGWRCRVTFDEAAGLTAGGWYPADAVRDRT